MSPRGSRSLRASAAATAVWIATLLLPSVAHASGSWAVPRFTPTWAELERDLRALGIKKRPKKPPTAPNPTAVAANPTAPATTDPQVSTNPTPPATTPTTTATQDTGVNACVCPPPPVLKCPDVPAAPATPVKKPVKKGPKKSWYDE